ncbi:hypothetical protein EYF80_017409 [Liparis tanakae]|uniref:Secreted protein n=1 Tax=Liparis tanakae TaxID=230148 RepID=A0A4Z2I3I0_9TELE|nr:hypothetical protein EYF80_017409 [Liparis tanakae]
MNHVNWLLRWFRCPVPICCSHCLVVRPDVLKPSQHAYATELPKAARDWSVPPSIVLARQECRAQEVEASFAVDCHSYTIAEDFWVT